MKLIVGLGNPGKQYEQTKHNMGFLCLDYMAEQSGISVNRIKFKALVGEGFIAGQKVIMMKPQTFMNLSGEAVREAAAFYKIAPQDLLVIYDDIDTPLGGIRIRKSGSAGTHNGMKSVIYQLQSDEFPRMRIGIGSAGRRDLADFVLSGFSKEEKSVLEKAVINASKAAEMIILGDIDNAMNIYNYKKPKKAVSNTENTEEKQEEKS